MQHKKLVACASAVVLAVGLACSKNSDNPTSPSGSEPGSANANPDGSTLKATAPAPVSPVNNQQPDSLVLVANKANALYGTPSTPFSYEFEVRNSGGTATVCPATIVGGGADSTVSFTPTCTLEFDQPYTWRVRATMGTASNAPRGPWSANATFKAPAGGYIRGNEIFDPLTNGRTVGDVFGATEWVPGQGLRLLAHDSHVTYRLPENLQAGEFSMMILGADEGSPGDKSKVFAMQEGPDEGDISDDDYRMSAELRGAQYSSPGQVRYRFKINDLVEDGGKADLRFNSSLWYFWKFEWSPGSGRLEVREGGPNGRVIYNQGVNMHGRTYKPDPHLVHLGAPIGRACPCDATLPGGIYKNVWVSSRPRPAFPGE
jgi:hypothetical protein